MRRAQYRLFYALAALLSVRAASAQAQEEEVRAALESAATQISQGHYSEALDTLRRVESAEPDNPWMWFYRGTAEQQLGEPYRAMDAYDRALKILRDLDNPDPALAAKIREQRFAARRQVLHLSLSTGLAYDTNVSYLGSSSGLSIISGKPDMLFATQAQLDYAPVATAQQALTFGTRLSHSWHFSIEEYNLQDYGAYVRYARRLSPHFDAAIEYDYDFVLLGNDSFLSDHVLTPSLTYHWLAPAQQRFRLEDTRVYYRFEDADFKFDTDRAFDRDGTAHGVGIEQSFKWKPVRCWNWTWDLAVGYLFNSFFTDGSEFGRREHNFLAGVSMPVINPWHPDKYLILPDKELVFTFNTQWQIGTYRDGSLIDADGDRRSDLLTTFNWGLSQTLIKSPEYGDLILHGLISWTNADSNVTTQEHNFPYRTGEPFTYDKVVYGLQLEWSW